ncbi:hypothetical protein ACT3R8_11100 [Halomonas sp. AOP42-C2-23]|uniref:hypothetical protein n=1 Tax=Halomonas sp. AOP42-C2-23 TaxID=3457669 RepID=UPI004034CD7C
MKGIDKKIREIKEQKIGNNGRQVLVVEGSDDVEAFELMLEKLAPEWRRGWVLAEAGKKSAVLEIVRREPTWAGVVDRDEWADEKNEELEAELRNLAVLPRYCLENYLIVPSELWAALPPKQKAKIPGGQQELQDKILEDLDRWVRHGVLWSVVNPLWEGLRSLGFKEKLLSVDIAEDDDEIKKILHKWHQFLKPEDIWARYMDRLSDVVQKPIDEKLKVHVHGKEFYKKVVNPTLNELLGQKRAEERQFSIIRTLPEAYDLQPVLDRLGLVASN